MAWQSTTLVIPLVVSGLLCSALGAYAWRHRRVPAARALVVLMGCSAWWSFAYALYRASADFPAKHALGLASQGGASAVALAWAVFALGYTGRERWLRPLPLAALASVQVATFALAVTNTWHGAFWSRFDPVVRGGQLAIDAVPAWGFWVHVAWSWGLMSLAVALVAADAWPAPRGRRMQGAAVVAAAAVPWLGNVLHLTGLWRFGANPMPFLFTLSGGAFFWAIFRLRLLDFVPVRRGALAAQRAYLEQLFHASPEGLALLDRDDRVIDVNRAWQALFGWSPEEARGRAINELIVPPHLQEEGAVATAHVVAGTGAELETLRLRRDGSMVDVHVTGMPVFAAGRQVGIWGIYRDISERKAEERARAGLLERERSLRAEAEAATLRAREAVRARDSVLGVVSHDLRNPLTAVLLQADSLLAEELPPELRSGIEHIIRSAEGMDRMIRDLLDVAAIEAGKLRVDPEPHDAAALARAAAAMMEPLAVERGVELETRVEGLEGTLVAADFDRVLQVFSNLVGNALKFTRAGGRVTLDGEAGAGEARFRVRDAGPGIPPEEAERVWHRFWQGDGPARRQGTGLGLAIVRGIVEAHGGRVWVESAGAGALFGFTLPAARITVPVRRIGAGEAAAD